MLKAEIFLQKVLALPPERIAEIEDFVAFIIAREEQASLTRDAMRVTAPSFAAVWDNAEDDAYDEL